MKILNQNTVSRFVRSVFELISEDALDKNEVEVSHSGDMNALGKQNYDGKLRMKHKINHVNVQRPFIGTGSCFCSGSIADGALKKENSISNAIYVRESILNFSICTHNLIPFPNYEHPEESSVIIEFFLSLSEAGRLCDEFIPSVNQLCYALSDSAMDGEKMAFAM